MTADETLTMLSDYMENGFLENIIDMFKHDRSLYRYLHGLMADERSRVRIGYVTLIETLMEDHLEDIRAVAPAIAGLLKDERPQVRADAAYMLEIIGDASVIPVLEQAVADEPVEPARESMQDSLEVLRGRG